MKDSICKGLKKLGKKSAVSVAKYYANVSCPLVFYQPEITDSIKKLRKF